MAIILDVGEYCQDCNEFQVDTVVYQKGFSGNRDFHVICKHKDKCRAMYKHLCEKFNDPKERF